MVTDTVGLFEMDVIAAHVVPVPPEPANAADDGAGASGHRRDGAQAAVVARLSEVPALHQAVLDVFDMSRQCAVDTGRIAEALQFDRAFSDAVLALANSPYYHGAGRQVVELEEAVDRVGPDG